MSCSWGLLQVCGWNTWSTIFSNPWHLQHVFFLSHIFSIYHRRGMRCWDLGYEKKEKTTSMSLAAKSSATKTINLFLVMSILGGHSSSKTRFVLGWTNTFLLNDLNQCWLVNEAFWLKNFEKQFWDCFLNHFFWPSKLNNIKKFFHNFCKLKSILSLKLTWHFRTWKWMVGYMTFPFGASNVFFFFRCFAVSFRECILGCPHSQDASQHQWLLYF